MTKIRESGDNQYIEDRRGQSGGQGGGSGLPFPIPGGGSGGGANFPGISSCGRYPLGIGGGGIALVVLLASLFLPRLLSGSVPAVDQGAGTPHRSGVTCDTATAQIVCGAVTDVNKFWAREFTARGESYTPAKTVFFNSATPTACGTGQAATGPFYCPLDQLAYFDLDFLDELQQRFGAPGDLATQYIVAHEYGHHVQQLTGIGERVRKLQESEPTNANAYSVRLELQADCFAGVWAHDANARGLLEAGDLDEALNAAAAVGDDRIQQQSGGRVNPETWTHGSSEQRRTWFRRGYDSGDRDACDTFSQ